MNESGYIAEYVDEMALVACKLSFSNQFGRVSKAYLL